MESHDVLIVASFLASTTALILSVFNLGSLERPLKRSAQTIAEVLRYLEPVIPALQKSRVDNYIRDVLRAYAASDPFFVQALQTTDETPDHVADVLPLLDPELKTLGKAISLPVDKSRVLMTSLVHRVKEYDQVVREIQEELQNDVGAL